MQKIENIEFLRIILIIGILCTHAFHSAKWAFWRVVDAPVLTALKNSPNFGMNAVEGFFLIAGFFLVYKFKDVDFKTFALNKYLRLVPLVIFSTILCVCLYPLHWFPLRITGDILSAFLLNNFGICWTKATNQDLWFSSALFSALLLYFPIIKLKSEKIRKLIALAVVVFCYILLEILRKGIYATPFQNYYGIINIGFIRAVGGVGLGCILCWIYKKYLKGFCFKYQSAIYSILEIFTFGGMVYWLFLPHCKISNFVFVIDFAVLLMLFVQTQGFLSKLLEKIKWSYFSRYIYSIYVTHFISGFILCNYLYKAHPGFVSNYPVGALIISFVFFVLFGILTYHIIERPIRNILSY